MYAKRRPSLRIHPYISSRKRKADENELEPKEVPVKDAFVNASHLREVISTMQNAGTEPVATPAAWPANQRFQGLTCYTSQTSRIPIPDLSWADKEELWNVMCQKNEAYKVEPNYLLKHPTLTPEMRAILLEWLTELCQEFDLYRETFYLAATYVDQYLSNSSNITTQHLQLIGTTALFIAAKVEEVYPLKLQKLTYLAAGIFTGKDILNMEIVMLKGLQFNLSPITINYWLNTYLQILQNLFPHQLSKSDSHLNVEENSTMGINFINKNETDLNYVRIMNLLDMCVLDYTSVKYTPRMLAASALGYFTSVNEACFASGYRLEELKECFHWMLPLASEAMGMKSASVSGIDGVSSSDLQNIQTHNVTRKHLENALARRNQMKETQASPSS